MQFKTDQGDISKKELLDKKATLKHQRYKPEILCHLNQMNVPL